jgi:photosystem II stability/assembly factor-like uncharacterized protein
MIRSRTAACRGTIVLLLTACSPAAPVPPAPVNVTAVEQTSGTTALLIAISPVNENVVWASGTAGTWVRTMDGGTTWQTGRVAGADSLQFRDVHAVDANTAWLLSIGNGDQSRIYHTTDGGKTWALQFTNSDPAAFFDCFDFWDARHGIAVSDAVNGRTVMIETTDGGAHWTPLTSTPAALQGEGSFAASGTCLVVRPGGHAWNAAGTPMARLLHTANYGRSWTVDTIPLTAISSVAFRDLQHGIVLGTDSSAATASTSDGGKTWVRGGAPPFGQGVYGGVFVPGAKTPAVVAVGPGGLAWSRDDGATWTVINNNIYWSVGFASPRAGWAVGARGRITKLSGF